ncbi:MAG: PAS domain S-box protein [Proteobacteria bacterium]|nr:PAS domain S-box protein [Pseudomonadota bacterium]
METRQTLFTLSQLNQFQQQNPDECLKTFANLLKQTEIYSGLAAIKPNGEVFASAPPYIKPINIADRPWFQRLVQSRRFVVGEYSIGRLTGKPTVILGYPVLDHTGRLMTVLTAALDLERLQQMLLKVDLPDGASLTVIDSNGTIIIRFPDPEKFVGKKMLEESIVKTMLTKKEGVMEGNGLDGVPRLFGYTTVGTGFEAIHVCVSIPEQVAYADLKRHMIRDLTLVGLVSVLALLGAWLFGKILIISPVNRLINVTKRLADGDLAVRSDRSTDANELGLLAFHFDQMADSLQSREQQRKLAKEALQANEEKYRSHFENISDVIFSYDQEFRILTVTPSLERLLRYKPEEFIGKSFAELNILSPEHLEKAFSDAMRALTGEHLDSIIYEFIAKDGTIKYGDVRSTPVLRGGQVVSVIAVARNITDYKKAKDMLRSTQFSVDQASECISWIDPDGRFLYVNDAYCRLLNYSRDEFLSMYIFDVAPDYSRENWLDYWSNYKQKMTVFFESSRRTKDGILIPVEINANYLAYEDKEFIVSFVRDISQRKLSEERLKRQFDRLAALRAIDMAITSSFDIRVTFSIFLEQVVACLGVDAADILILNTQMYNRLTFVAGRGFRTDALRHTNLKLGAGYAGMVAQERKTICIHDLQKEPQDLLKKSPQFSNEDFVTYHAVPLIAKGHVKGVLEIFNRTSFEHNQDWLDFLEALAQQAAIAIDNVKLFDDLQKSNIDLLQAYDNTLEGWSNALDLRDKETEGHSQRVTEMTLRLAGKMGIRDSELMHVRRGALLHDIGKMGIPDKILLKPGALNDEEWKIMRKHPVYAYELLYPISYLRPALEIPYSHHEKWDGTGYPSGLKAEYIPLAARIFAIVDVWDALRSERPYRPAWPEEKTIKHIREQSGTHFDPKVVAAFLELINELKPE